jgi:hypothetical protein
VQEAKKMSIDGNTYGFVYCGANGVGIGAFTISGERFRGTDMAGGRYDGTARENPDGSIDLNIEFDVMPGETLVQGTAPQEVPHRRRVSQTLPPQFGDGEPLKLQSPPGTLTIMVKRIPDEWARAAIEGVTLTIGRQSPS